MLIAWLVLACVLVACGGGQEGVPPRYLTWDSNIEADMLEYEVERDGVLRWVVGHVEGQERQGLEVPAEWGCYRVRAIDNDHNSSELSEEVCG